MKSTAQFLAFILVIALMGCQGPPQNSQPVHSPTTGQQTVAPSETPQPAATVTATETPALEVVVTTEEDILDGDTTQVDALLANPGADGAISLREAIQASNQTPGPKRITFAPALKGATLFLGKAQQYDEPRLLFTMDQLIVNGDVDGDGVGDVTLDGSALNPNNSTALILSASDIAIENLKFNGFRRFTLAIACVDDRCADRSYEHIEIRNNAIVSEVGGGGILLTPMKIVSDTTDPTLFSHISISDVKIVANRIAVSNGGNPGIFIAAAGAGGSDNRLADILIHDNTITSPGATITVNGGDGSSYYFQLPGEEKFSDRNVVEGVVITSNSLDPRGIGTDSAHPSGVVMIGGNFGNSDNVIRNVLIGENEISANGEHMVILNPTNNEVLGGLPLTTRAATGNLIENVEIVGNISHVESAAFTLLASSGQDPAPKGATGRIAHVWIHDNQVLDYKWEGVAIFAGVGENANLIEDVVIERNTFTALDITKGVALFVYAGGCSGCSRPSDGNRILGLVIRDNVVNNNNFIFMNGGMEDYASNNMVEYFLGPNDLTPPGAVVDIADYAAKNNVGNRAVALEQEP